MAIVDDATRASHSDPPPPLGQRLFDNVFLLLVLGVAIMLIVFTGWGLWEIAVMPQATLP